MSKDDRPSPGLGADADPPALESEFHEHLFSAKSASERQSILELTRELARLQMDKTAAALETSAAIAAISLRASIEFLRAAPAARKFWKLRSCAPGATWAGAWR